MKKIYAVTLIPLKNLEDDTFLKVVKEYYNKGEVPIMNRWLFNENYFDVSKAISLLVKKVKDDYIEITTGKSICTLKGESEKFGYVCLKPVLLRGRKINSINREEISSDERVTQFLSECQNNRDNLMLSMESYISRVFEDKEAILDYADSILKENPFTIFKWVYIYNDSTKEYERVLLPLRDNNEHSKNVCRSSYNYLMSNGIIPYTSDYTDVLFNNEVQLNGKDNGGIYTEKGETTMFEDDFEVLSNIYELMYNGDKVRGRLEETIKKKSLKR